MPRMLNPPRRRKISKTFGERLKALRQAREMSYRQMQEALFASTGLKVSHQTLRKWELHDNNYIPGRENIEALCKFFNVEARLLLEDLIGPSFGDQKNNRINQWTDVDLLKTEDHELLLAMKKRLISQRDSASD